MLYKDENGKYRKPKEVFPSITDVIKNHKFWNKRRLNYLGDDRFFDQEIRTGVCFFCNRENRKQRSEITNLAHVNYDHSDPLAWTIEVCKSCHWQIDPYNREVIARKTGKEIKRRYGKYAQPYYENKEQRMERAERANEGWYMNYCSNIDGKFVPIPRLIPDIATFDKVVEAIKKAASKRNTMSDVSHRYF